MEKVDYVEVYSTGKQNYVAVNFKYDCWEEYYEIEKMVEKCVKEFGISNAVINQELKKAHDILSSTRFVFIEKCHV